LHYAEGIAREFGIGQAVLGVVLLGATVPDPIVLRQGMRGNPATHPVLDVYQHTALRVGLQL
tara:strand:+ start:398 stop:583 length:186 start_codon:yes stop_codon:yes gene_type:complete